jgi:hypothetical protein
MEPPDIPGHRMELGGRGAGGVCEGGDGCLADPTLADPQVGLVLALEEDDEGAFGLGLEGDKAPREGDLPGGEGAAEGAPEQLDGGLGWDIPLDDGQLDAPAHRAASWARRGIGTAKDSIS